MAFPTVTGAASRSNFEVKEKRYGTIAARIYSSHLFRQTAGSPSYYTVEDITRNPEAVKHAKWRCNHIGCQHKSWATKSDLLAAHEDNRLLKQKQEVHLYFAAAECPAVEAKPEKRDGKGELLHAAVDAKPARTVLLSDEE